jgi:hypothetical protein
MAVGPAGMSVRPVCARFDPRRVATPSGETRSRSGLLAAIRARIAATSALQLRRRISPRPLVARLSVASVALPVAYAPFGTSRQLMVNADTATCAMVAAGFAVVLLHLE